MKKIAILVFYSLWLMACGGSSTTNESQDAEQDIDQVEPVAENVRPADQTISGQLQFTLGEDTYQFDTFNKMKTDFLLADESVTMILTLPDKKRIVSLVVKDEGIYDKPLQTYSMETGKGSGITFQGFASGNALNAAISNGGEITLEKFDPDNLLVAGSFKGEVKENMEDSMPFEGRFEITFSNKDDYRMK